MTVRISRSRRTQEPGHSAGRRTAAQALVGLGMGFCAPGLMAQAPATTGYFFSPVLQYGVRRTAEYWNLIIGYASEKSGVPVQLKMGRTSTDNTSYVLAREVQFTFTDHLFAPERERMGWKVIARRDLPQVFAEIVVLDESPVKTLEDLQGLEVAVPGPEAVIAYKMPAAELHRRGINVRFVFAGTMDGALAQLASGKVAAIGCNSQLAKAYVQREKLKARKLWQSAALYDLAFTASPQVAPQDAQRLVAALVGMATDPRGQQVLAQANAIAGLPLDKGFIPSDGSEYSAYREFYRTAPEHLR